MIFLASLREGQRALELTERKGPPSGPNGPERWLQLQIMEHPGVLLAGGASPKHARVRSIGCEVVLSKDRRIDWLGISPEGEIVLAEVKLFANGEARREIVAQALDYYSALRGLSYEGLEQACRQASFTKLSDDAGLFEAAGAGHASYTLEAFAQRVTDNLRTGNILLVMALDHVPFSLARIVSDLFMDQPGLPFLVSLVEIGLYDEPGGGILLVPKLHANVLTRTRAVVRLEGRLTVESVSEDADPAGRPAKRSREEFLALLDKTGQGIAAKLSAFLEKAAEIGVHEDVAKSMVLRLGGVNVGSIGMTQNVQVYVTSSAREVGMDAFMAYVHRVGALVGIASKPDGQGNEPMLKCSLSALLEREANWLEALSIYRDALPLDYVGGGSA